MLSIFKKYPPDQDDNHPVNDNYHDLFDNMLEGLAYCRMIFKDGQPVDFVYLDVNKSFSKLTGLENVIGHRVTEIIPDIKSSNPELFEIYGRVCRGGKPEKFESFSELFGGWLSVSVYSPGKDRFVAVFDNITQRKNMEKALKEAEQHYKTIFEGVPFGIVIINPQTAAPIEFNDQTCRQLGYTREEFAKLKISDIEAIEKPEETKQHFEKVIREGRDDFETKQYTKNHETRDVQVIAQTFHVDGKLMYHCIWRDITESKKAESKLREAYDEDKKMLDIMTGREQRMIELKNQVQQLENEIAKLKAGSK